MKLKSLAVVFALAAVGALGVHLLLNPMAVRGLLVQTAPPVDRFTQLKQTMDELKGVAAQSNSGRDTADLTRELVAQIDTTVQRILEEDDVTPEVKGQVRGVQVHAYQMAARQAPAEYRKQFDDLSQQLIRDLPQSPLAMDVALCRFAVDHDLTQPLAENGLDAISHEAGRLGDPLQRVALYGIVSQRLHSNGQVPSAKVVLDAGLKKFHGQPGWHRLFQQQFDQGYLADPKPKHGTGPYKTLAKCGRKSGRSRSRRR